MANKKVKKNDAPLFSIYGARVSQSGKYANISIVKTVDDEKMFETVPVKIEGGKVAVKVDEEYVYLKIKRLDIDKDNVDVF